MDVAEVDEVSIGENGNCEDETIGRSPSKNLNRATDYLASNAKQSFT